MAEEKPDPDMKNKGVLWRVHCVTWSANQIQLIPSRHRNTTLSNGMKEKKTNAIGFEKFMD